MKKEIPIRWIDEIPQIQWDSVKGTTSGFSDAKYWIPSWRIKASSMEILTHQAVSRRPAWKL